MEKLLYIGNCLTGAPEEFLKEIALLKAALRALGWVVLDYIGLTDGDSRDVWNVDMKKCVGGCKILLGIADHASTGLGIEIGLMIGRHQGPVLIAVHNDQKVTRAIQAPDEENVVFLRYASMVRDLPILLERFYEILCIRQSIIGALRIRPSDILKGNGYSDRLRTDVFDIVGETVSRPQY